MAEVVLGDIVARLRVDNTQFEQALTQAQARLGQLNQTTAQTTSQQGTANQSTQQLAQAYLALAQSIGQQTQAYSQAQQAALQYKQTQDQVRASLQSQREAHQQAAQAAQAAARLQQQAQQQAAIAARETARQQAQAARDAAQAQIQAARDAARAQAQAARDAAQAQREAAREAQRGGGAFGNILQIAGGIGVATGISALVSQMRELAVATVEVGTRFESLRNSLSALGGGPATGLQQFQGLFEMAQRLGVAFEPLAQGFRRLTAAATQAGLPVADQIRLLDALAKEARRTGASQEELGRAITAVAQIASKGKVSMEELRQQLGEAIPTAMAAAAFGMGKTTEELEKLIETGTVRFPTFARALARGFEQLQGQSGAMAEGAREAFTRLENAWKHLEDTIFKSGLGTYLKTVSDNLREAVEWTDKLISGKDRSGALGPTMQDLGFTADQEKQLRILRGFIEAYERKAQVETNPAHRQQILDEVARARERVEQITEAARATQEQGEAQRKVTQEANRTAHAIEQQADFTRDFTTALNAADKAAEAFRRKAAIAPEREGRLGGTFEEAQKYRQGLAEATGKEVDRLRDLISEKPEGVTVPPGLQARYDAYKKGYGDTEKAIKSADEAEKKRQQTERETAAQTERAVGQRIQLEQLLTRAKAFGAKEDQNAAEAARARVEAEGAAMRTDLEQGLEAIRRNPQIGGDYAQRLRDALAALPGQIEAQAADAYAKALERQIEPLENLARGYGFASKAASDLAKAQDEVMKLLGGPLEEQAFRYLEVIEGVARIEAQIPDLEAKAAASRRAGMEAVAGATADTAFRQNLRDQLERLQAPREERLELRLRAQARKEGIIPDEALEAQFKAIGQQERLNALVHDFQQLAPVIANAWTGVFTAIFEPSEPEGLAEKRELIAYRLVRAEERLAEVRRSQQDLPRQMTLDQQLYAQQTVRSSEDAVNALRAQQRELETTESLAKRVGEAFKAMAKAILDAVAQMAVNKGVQALFNLGVTLLTAAVAPSTPVAGGGTSFGSAGTGSGFLQGTGGSFAFQHGGVVNRPTMALIGENAANNPEYVLNRQQMSSLMTSARQAGPSAGGQAMGGANVTVINVASREQGEQEAARERALGRTVIMNTIMDDLAAGSGSRINQMIRAGSR